MRVIVGIVLGFVFVSCSFMASDDKHSNTSPVQNENDYCLSIDTLVRERYEWKSGNFYANKIIPKLEKASKIESLSHKGTYGYIYESDSLFDSDISKWRKYFKCK